MSKNSSRPGREEIKSKRKEKKKQEKLLRAKLISEGHKLEPPPPKPNTLSKFETVDEEAEYRTDAAVKQMQVMRAQLPVLLRRLSKIPDPRAPKKIKHKLTCLIIYGILTFVFQMSSRRASNQEMSQPQFKKNLILFFS